MKNDTLQCGRNKEYPYGTAHSTPRIHCYGKGAQIQLFNESRVERVGLVQNGFVRITNVDL